jgi:hypothetical protein
MGYVEINLDASPVSWEGLLTMTTPYIRDAAEVLEYRLEHARVQAINLAMQAWHSEHVAANAPYESALAAATCEADREQARATATAAYATALTTRDAAIASAMATWKAASPGYAAHMVDVEARKVRELAMVDSGVEGSEKKA